MVTYITIHLIVPQTPKGKAKRAPRLDIRKKSVSLDSPDTIPFNQSNRGTGTIYENIPTG